MDQFDRAQALELAERESVLQRQREDAGQHNQPSLSHCQDCGVEIPPKRRAIRGVTRCVDCQELFEEQQKRGVRYGN